MKPADLDYADDAKAALLSQDTRWAGMIVYTIAAFFAVFLVWAHFAVLEEMTTGIGRVIPSSQVKLIQSLEGGMIEAMPVSEGAKVQKDEVIVRLDDTGATASYRENNAKRIALVADGMRLRAIANFREVIPWPKEFVMQHPQVVARSNDLFRAQWRALNGTLTSLRKGYALAQSELRLTKPLVAQGVVAKIELIRLEQRVNVLHGSIDEKIKAFRFDADGEWSRKNDELSALTERLVSDRDRMVRTTMRSPVSGTVKKIHVSTIGQVVKPGESIMEIVPDEDTLLIQARITPNDVGFIHPGQDATVKITAYDYSIYGGLTGKVEYIGADTVPDDKGNPYYEVLVRTSQRDLVHDGRSLPIIPGMVASIHIITGHKSILQYIMKPILRANDEALHER